MMGYSRGNGLQSAATSRPPDLLGAPLQAAVASDWPVSQVASSTVSESGFVWAHALSRAYREPRLIGHYVNLGVAVIPLVVAPPTRRVIVAGGRLAELLDSWLAEEDDYEDRTWPRAHEMISRNRLRLRESP